MKTYRAYLFDWDNTLAQTASIWVAAIRHGLERNNIQATDAEIAKNLGDLHWFEQFGLDDATRARMHREIAAEAIANLTNVALYDGARELLESLKQRGKKLGLVTAAEKASLDVVLDAHALRHYFDVIVCREDEPSHKPDPASVRLALERLGESATSAIMIGDNYKDIKAAHNAGVDSVLFYPNSHTTLYELAELESHNPTYIVHDLLEVKSVGKLQVMKLIVARHGQSVTNDVGIMAGAQDDSPLTPQGWMDAAELAGNLRSFHGLIVSSPLHRAQQTAEFVRDQLQPGAPIRIDPDFVERDMGNATDKPREEYERMEREDATIAGAETPEHMFERIKRGLDNIREDGEDTLLVAHGQTYRMIVCILQGLSPHEYISVPLPKNGEFHVFDL